MYFHYIFLSQFSFFFFFFFFFFFHIFSLFFFSSSISRSAVSSPIYFPLYGVVACTQTFLFFLLSLLPTLPSFFSLIRMDKNRLTSYVKIQRKKERRKKKTFTARTTKLSHTIHSCIQKFRLLDAPTLICIIIYSYFFACVSDGLPTPLSAP